MNEPGTIPVEYLSSIGAKGGKATTEAKKLASKLNGLSGGRPCKVYIYGLLNLSNGRVEYVGQTKNIRQRIRGHVTRSGRKVDPIPFQLGVVILAVCDERNSNDIERQFYEHYKSFGECSMNGEKYIPYHAHTPKWLSVNER